MRILKSMIAGSVGAGMLLATGLFAQAADAPKADKGREPVWRCDTAGFIEYPGSDVCFKIGGFVIAWIQGVEKDGVGTTAGSASEGFETGNVRDRGFTGPGGVGDDSTIDTFQMGTKGRLSFDIRQATELGLVRAYIEMEALDRNSNSSGTLNLRHAFIQAGNWLMGKTWTTFRSIAGTASPFIDFNAFGIIGDQRTVRMNQLRYTIKLGNGVTVNLAIEDPAFHAKQKIDSSSACGGGVCLTDSRNEVPDFVANIQFRGSWGKAQISASVHENRFIDARVGAGSDNETGYAVLAAIALNVPRSRHGDTIYLMGQYADGHQGAIESGAGFTQSLVIKAGGGVDTVESWTVAGGYTHKFRKDLRGTIGATHVDNDYQGGLISPVQIDEANSVYANIVWTLVKKLEVGIGVLYGRAERVSGEEGEAVSVAVQGKRSF